MKSAQISNVLRSAFLALVFAGSIALSGCSADAISGPEQNEGPAMHAASQPHGSQPGNDDCSVGGC
jgi:hypothetical protein